MKPLISALAATRTGPRVLVGFAGLAVLAAAIWPVDASAPEPPPPVHAATWPSDTGGAIRRPLFDPQRRSWTAQGTLADLDAAPARPVLGVRGIFVDGGAARALIAVEGAGDPVWLSRGDGRGDWQVADIAAGHVTIEQDGRSYTLPFLGAPATLRPPRRRRVPADEVAAPAAAAEPSEPPLRLATKTGRAAVRTIPIAPQR